MRAEISWACTSCRRCRSDQSVAHVALDRADGAVGVGDRLALGDLADEHFAALGERDHRRRGAVALGVGDVRAVNSELTVVEPLAPEVVSPRVSMRLVGDAVSLRATLSDAEQGEVMLAGAREQYGADRVVDYDLCFRERCRRAVAGADQERLRPSRRAPQGGIRRRRLGIRSRRRGHLRFGEGGDGK
jgi:hypothetical protein